jgi:hypothetical protein
MTADAYVKYFTQGVGSSYGLLTLAAGRPLTRWQPWRGHH